MEKRNIGKSGLSAPFLGMGTWAIGGGSWWGDNDDALSVKAILTAVEQGITWVDTAPIYGLYHSEEVVGEALKHLDRDKIIRVAGPPQSGGRGAGLPRPVREKHPRGCGGEPEAPGHRPH